MAATKIDLGKTSTQSSKVLFSQMANRHGLVAGATGTGKTVTLRLLAEAFSSIGVPVFTADIKGDLAGLAFPGIKEGKVAERLSALGVTEWEGTAFPVIFWDVFGEKGHPLRTTLSELGPLLLSRLFDLNDVQEGVLQIAFKLADDEGMLLLDLKDLRAVLQFMSEHADEIQAKYGNVAKASIGAIQRDILAIEQSGGERFFGEPALNLAQLLLGDSSGRGLVHVLDATKLISSPALYTTFLLWLLSELFEQLPEVGDVEKPKLVFFFDEAHLLFDSAPKALLEKIEQMTRLIRSKGVGVYYVSQNPLDVPDEILGQLGNRFQHALRAFTPRDQKAVRAAAETFRANPGIDTAEAITQLAVGEALISVLDEQGVPTPVERVLVTPPRSRIGAITDEERRAVIEKSPLRGIYETAIDRESAFEILKKRRETLAESPNPEPARPQSSPSTGSKRQGFGEAFFKSVLRSVGSAIGRQISRGVFGTMRR